MTISFNDSKNINVDQIEKLLTEEAPDVSTFIKRTAFNLVTMDF